MSRAIARKCFHDMKNEILPCGLAVGTVIDDSDHRGQPCYVVVSWSEGRHNYLDHRNKSNTVPLLDVHNNMPRWCDIASIGPEFYHEIIKES